MASQDQALLTGLRVLVVDDNEDTCVLVALALEFHAAEVRTANSVSEALKIMQQWQPDVIVSDIAMPIEDGYSFIKKVKSLGSMGVTIPAIALTAYAYKTDAQRALAAGFQKYLVKPLEPQVLVAEIVDVIGSQSLRSALIG